MLRPRPANALGPITLWLHLCRRVAGLAVAAAGALGGWVFTVVHILVAMCNTMHKARTRTAWQPALQYQRCYVVVHRLLQAMAANVYK
jgi:hypothetical protein